MKSALEKLRDAYPEAAGPIERIVDLVFTPNELWRDENYGDKFFSELERRLTGLTEFVKVDLRTNHGLDGNIQDVKEVCDIGSDNSKGW